MRRQAKLKNPVRYWLGKKRLELRKKDKEKSKWKEYRKQIQDRQEYKEWRRKVFERDNYTCQNKKCNTKSGNGKTIYLEAHHKKEAKKYPELIYKISNGITLCDKCHNETKKGRLED